MLPPRAEIMHALAPGAVADRFEMIAHDDLNSIRAQPGLRGDGGEADMVGQRHLYDFAQSGGL